MVKLVTPFCVVLQAGFAFYESGTVRSKNVTSVLFRNYMNTCILEAVPSNVEDDGAITYKRELLILYNDRYQLFGLPSERLCAGFWKRKRLLRRLLLCSGRFARWEDGLLLFPIHIRCRVCHHNLGITAWTLFHDCFLLLHNIICRYSSSMHRKQINSHDFTTLVAPWKDLNTVNKI